MPIPVLTDEAESRTGQWRVLNGDGQGRPHRLVLAKATVGASGVLVQRVSALRLAVVRGRTERWRLSGKWVMAHVQCQGATFKDYFRLVSAQLGSVAARQLRAETARRAALRTRAARGKLLRMARHAWSRAWAGASGLIDRWVATVRPVRLKAQNEKVTRIVNERERG